MCFIGRPTLARARRSAQPPITNVVGHAALSGRRHTGLGVTALAPFTLAIALASVLFMDSPPSNRFGGSSRLLADEPPRQNVELSATFSIVAVDPQTGEVGAAVASKYPAVGKVVPYVRAGVGGFCTQHHHVPKWGEPALDALAQGLAPERVIANLLKDDPDRELRQLAIIDMSGRAAVHNPTTAPEPSRYWAAMTGRFYCCQGNTLKGRAVITEMARAYEETAGSLTDRLMAALVAGERAGGDHRGRLAAGIRVAKKGVEGYSFELYVDKSDDAVAELARKYAERKQD